MKPKELLEHAVTFAFYPAGAKYDEVNGRNFRVTVERRGTGDAWALVHMGDVWNGEDWVYESLPSNRTDEFKAETRFPLMFAVEMANKLVEQITINGFTYSQWQERFAAMEAAEAAANKG